jgi:uncharacterized protein YraI
MAVVEVEMKHIELGIAWVRVSVMLGIAGAMVLTGCAPTQPSQTAYETVGDECSVFRKPLMETSEDLSKWQFQGALAGAATGALIGGLVGGDMKSALLGGLGGALVGGTLGYLEGRRKEAASKEELLRAIDGDAGADSARLRQFTAAIDRLGACRQRQLNAVKLQYVEGEIPAGQAYGRMSEIRAAIDGDNQLIEEVMGRTDERYGVYVDAKAEVLGVGKAQVAPETASYEAVVSAVETYDLKPVTKTFVTRSGVNVRSGPSETTAKIGSVPANNRVSATGQTADGQWYAFPNGDRMGFIHASLLAPAVAGEEEDPISTMAEERQRAQVAKVAYKSALDHQIDALEALLPSTG